MTNNLRPMGWRSLVISLVLVSGSLTLNSCGNAPSGDGVSGSVAPAPQGSAESKADRVIADGGLMTRYLIQKLNLLRQFPKNHN